MVKICHWTNDNEKLKEGSCILVAKTLKDITNNYLKLEKSVFTISHPI